MCVCVCVCVRARARVGPKLNCIGKITAGRIIAPMVTCAIVLLFIYLPTFLLHNYVMSETVANM